MPYPTPHWIDALPAGDADWMYGDEAGALDVINRPAKELWSYIQSLETQQFPSGTKMVFYQAAAPIGWTQTTDDNRMLRVVSGVGGGSGGNDSPISHFHTGGDHTLTILEIPAHAHSVGIHRDAKDDGNETQFQFMHLGGSINTSSVGGDQPHNHGDTNPYNPRYMDVILCSKD